MDQINLKCDILIAGGGVAGVTAAIAAARNGAKVILCQDRSVLGGNASSEIRMHIVGADGSGKRGKELETEARESGIIEEIRLETAVRNPQRSASMFDLILYEKCRENNNITLLLNTSVTDAHVTDNKISSVTARRESTEDIFNIEADIFIDCTGDGRLGKEAGALYRWGREGHDEFNEQFAQEKPDNKRQGSTLLFQAKDMGQPVPFTPPRWIRKFTEEDLTFRPHSTSGVDNGLEYGYWWVEWGGELDTIKDNEEIRDELLAIMLGVWDHIKNDGDHGADNWALDWFGFLPGKRESRRFIGMHTLTENDIMASQHFEDAIAYGGWHIDLHPPEGIDAAHLKPTYGCDVPYLFDIPLRACISGNIDNLMFAGRNISATHVAFASTRVMATCSVIGQGVGTAAAYSVKQKLNIKNLVDNKEHISNIQQNLLRDDAYLIGVLNDDVNDLARSSHITCSSEQDIGEVVNIISGQTRAITGPKGAPKNRGVLPGTNRWMSLSEDRKPWIKLRWDENIKIGKIQLTFDSGLHRILTLSHSNDYVKKMKWGVPQPELVKDYKIEILVEDKWQTILDVKDNYQRNRIHKFDEKLNTNQLRISVLKTQGIDHARIKEVRVYPES